MASILLAQGARVVSRRAAVGASGVTAGAAAAVVAQRWISSSDIAAGKKGKPSRNPPSNAGEKSPAGASTGATGAGSTSSTPASDSTSTPPPPEFNPQSASDAQPQSAPDLSSLPSLDFTATSSPALPSPGGSASGGSATTGAKSSKESLSTIERRRRFLGRVGMVMFGAGLVGAWVYMGREWEADEDIPENGKEMGRWERANARMRTTTDVFDKPAWKELLPPPLPPTHQRPYTLLISMEDLMTASTWDREHGWRTAKRPGIEYFLAYLSQFYEIVVFTSQYAYSAIPILEAVDPYTLYISYKLFRESTRSVDGQIVKDLTYLNRDLSKVIAIDTVPEHLALQPENAIIIPKWKGEKELRAGLVNLIPILESIAIHRPDDVRPILKAYQGKDVALEYAKFEAEMKKRHIEQWKAKGGAGSATSWLHKLIGGPSGPPTTSPSGVPLTYLEQKRLEAQEIYKQEQAYYKEQEPVLKKYLDDMREQQTKEMAGGSLFGMLSGQSGPLAALNGPPQPAPQEVQQGQKVEVKDGSAASPK